MRAAPCETRRGAPGPWRAAEYGFLLALCALHAGLWWWAKHQEGVWHQAPATDEAHDLATAWLFHRALLAVDPDGLIRTWVAGSSVHTPLVPLCSALLMRLLGTDRMTAELVLPLFMSLWIVAVYGIVRHLYGCTIARLTTALATSFPVFLIYSRPYLFEQAWAAMFAVACWYLLASDGFYRLGPTIAFGTAVGLTALARGGGFVLLAGPVGVVLWVFRNASEGGRRLTHATVATAIALAFAASWYAPNLRPFLTYVRDATYGRDAFARTGSAAALSWAGMKYYLIWLIAQGPGWPMLLLTIAAIVVVLFERRARRGPSAIAAALAAVFAIDFAVLSLGMQRQGARYFLPLTPLLALVIVRTIHLISSTIVRRALGLGITLAAVHHVVALSIVLPRVDDPFAAPYVHGVPLWDHRTYFKTLVQFYRLSSPADDFKIPQIVAWLGRLPIPPRALIAVVGPAHGFFHRNGFQLESIRQAREWHWLADVYVDEAATTLILPPADVVIVRGDPPTALPLNTLLARIPVLSEPEMFRDAGTFYEGDGSTVKVYVRVTAPSRQGRPPDAPPPRYPRSVSSIARFPFAPAAAR